MRDRKNSLGVAFDSSNEATVLIPVLPSQRSSIASLCHNYFGMLTRELWSDASDLRSFIQALVNDYRKDMEYNDQAMCKTHVNACSGVPSKRSMAFSQRRNEVIHIFKVQ